MTCCTMFLHWATGAGKRGGTHKVLRLLCWMAADVSHLRFLKMFDGIRQCAWEYRKRDVICPVDHGVETAVRLRPWAWLQVDDKSHVRIFFLSGKGAERSDVVEYVSGISQWRKKSCIGHLLTLLTWNESKLAPIQCSLFRQSSSVVLRD
ncbi:hypothetical protein M433DRAFT_455364 [Acidomyces richmondensis BFW]|nr:hypothetical protein M433DRAFT_455364 [Acidomyces richmondensis BFW]